MTLESKDIKGYVKEDDAKMAVFAEKLGVIHADVKEIRETIKEYPITKKQVDNIAKCVFGNGELGLKDRTTKLETMVTIVAWTVGVGIPSAMVIVTFIK